jgi:hypothetical protein
MKAGQPRKGNKQGISPLPHRRGRASTIGTVRGDPPLVARRRLGLSGKRKRFGTGPIPAARTGPETARTAATLGTTSI